MLRRAMQVPSRALDWGHDIFSEAGWGGTSVTRDSMIRVSAVLASVRAISESIACLPIEIQRSNADGSVVAVPDHAVWRLLALQPNPTVSAFTMVDLLLNHSNLDGNGYAVINRNGLGEVTSIVGLMPEWVQVFIDRGRKFHRVSLPGSRTLIVDDADMIHIMGPTRDGLGGMSTINAYARDVVGNAIAVAKYGEASFSNGAAVTVALQTEKDLSPERSMELATSFNQMFRGVKNAGKTVILSNGLTAKPLNISHADLQFIEQKKFLIGEIARLFRVPPHMIGDLDRATFSNIEHQAIQFVQHSLLPWIKRLEQQFDAKLFPKGDYQVRFNVKGLLRGDFKSQNEAYREAIAGGWMKINEVRRLEGLPPVDGGDELRAPLNTGPIQPDGSVKTPSKAAKS